MPCAGDGPLSGVSTVRRPTVHLVWATLPGLTSSRRANLPRRGWGACTRRRPKNICAVAGIARPYMVQYPPSVAGATSYQGCSELGAIPSVMLERPVGTSCELWRSIDCWVAMKRPLCACHTQAIKAYAARLGRKRRALSQSTRPHSV